MKMLIAFVLLFMASPLSAGQFCRIDNFGNKHLCFPTLSSCKSGSSSMTCAYFDDQPSVAQKVSPPSFVGPSKWCIFSNNTFLKNLALCSYDTKAECAKKIFFNGDECLLNPRFESDPREDAAAIAPPADRSKWLFFFKSESMEGYFDISSIFHYNQFVDVRIAVNTSVYRSQKIESTLMDVTIDCEQKLRRMNRAIGMSAQYGEGNSVRDMGADLKKSGADDFISVSEYPLMEALAPRVCARRN